MSRFRRKKRLIPTLRCATISVSSHTVTGRRINPVQSDFSTSKTVRQYVGAKLQNQILSDSLRRIGDRRWSTVANCSQALGVKYCASCGVTHVDISWCCRHRLCGVCAIRRSRKTGKQALDAFKYMQEQGQLEGARLALLTLTQRNVPAADLGDELDKLLAALTSIRHVREVRRSILGAARNVEITYNAQARSYHPHVHLILILAQEAPDGLLSARYWRDLWRRLMHLNYDPICDLRPITDSEGAICEVSKYCIKPSSIFGLNLEPEHLDQVVFALNQVLAGRRLVSYTGIWRKARQVLNQRDPDDDLEHDDSRDICGCGAALMDAVLRWDGLQYSPDCGQALFI